MHNHNDECCARIECKLDQVLEQLDRILERESDIVATIDDILSTVQTQGTFEASILTLIQNALANAGVPQAKIDATVAALTANQSTLQQMNDALVAGTGVTVPPVTPASATALKS